MWKEPNPDPGGDPPEGSSKSFQEFPDSKDEHENQQILLAQLKEMFTKQEQSTVTHQKVEEYVHTLSKMKAKKSKTKRDDSSSTERGAVIDSIKKEKVNLLKQQLEQNKAKLAERGKSQKGIEEMVTQIKAQLNDSQQLINSAPISLTVIDHKNVEYNKNTSQEELYNILIMKERKVTELLNKTQKQEATILDLQENLREKDSVLDARTKAITLMTDSLSKKGKDTLDALDETKEQMRTMQENFVTLESEMKARQLKLLDDLKAKNLEIAELKELNKKLLQQQTAVKKETESEELKFGELVEQLSKLKEEREQFLKKNSDLENSLREALQDINRLKNVGISNIQAVESSDSDVAKLKKQLEDSNKNMIKIKAQSKSKIKELNKKIDAFKKMNDANALIIELQNENTKLSEKIAELEEEKGNMQLKMVESTESTKDAALLEENMDMQEKLQQNKIDIEEKEKIISLLDSDIISLNEEIKSLKEKLSTLSDLQNVQVTSEIKSIQIEEKLDTLEHEKQQLKENLENVMSEKRELEQKIEELDKEKQDLNIKLENYIQENIELIDKLEKLSAEKVSSAESIEIVEGLTQQEKLELAAYQKLNLEETKSPEYDIPETPQELNESVLQLNEDTTELLKKIEMFNVERKEVMSKMEILKEENNNLTLKISEIENSRDILADTYEQLQSEKEELQTQNDELLKKIEHLESDGNRYTSSNNSESSAKLQEMQSAYDGLLQENESLKAALKQFDTKVHEKDNLDSELRECRLKIEHLESELKTNLEDITNYQSIIEENKNELVDSATLINELQSKLSERENDVKELNVLIHDLNVVVASLQSENEKLGNFELMESQVQELKTALNEQIEQAQDYAEEIAFNKNVIAELNAKLEEMNKRILDTEHEMEMKNIDVERLKSDLLQKEDIIVDLKNQISQKDEKINIISTEMKEKYLILQKQLDGNSGSLEQKIEELTHKNKEQLEKMKKIAATLKKKSQAYQDLEALYTKEKEQWESQTNIQGLDQLGLLTQVKELKEDINNKTVKLEDSEARIRGLTIQVQNLEQDLHNSTVEMRRKQEKISEVSLKQELSTSLHEDFEEEHGNKESANEEKIRELELIIETNEADLSHYRERLQKLEEELSESVENRELYQRKMTELEEKVKVSCECIQEKVLLEETLEQKLAQVSANDELLSKKLEESIQENAELLQKNKEQEELVNKLKIKVKKAHDKVTQLKAQQSNIEELETTNAQLKQHLAYLENNQKHVQEENEALQKRNQNDYDKIEADYQGQLEELLRTKNELSIECEKLREELKIAADKEEELMEEISELKGKLEEIDVLRETVRVCKEKEEGLLNEISMTRHLLNENENIVNQLSVNLDVTTNNWNDSLKQIEASNQQIESLNYQLDTLKHDFNGLQEQIGILQKQLFVKTAETTVEEVVTEAVKKIVIMNTKETQTIDKRTENVEISQPSDLFTSNKQEIVPTFQWPGQQSVVSNLPSTAWSDLESQIFSPSDIVDASNKKVLQTIEFEQVQPSGGEQSVPVLEDVLQPKQAYLTYQPGGAAFGENDDGWGWGPEEAKLEEEHQNREEYTPQMQNMKTQLAQALEKMQVLQIERENHLEEIRQLQIKSGKLIKKCKELKLLNEQLSTQKHVQKADDFFNLDDTIQEELKTQLSQMEKKIKEITFELDKEKGEKNKILKQVDVLTSANERLVELKEIQDSEVFRWKRKYEEIDEKMHQFEWSSDGFGERPTPKQTEVADNKESLEELQKQIQELSQDNEELQILLNEQRELKAQAEKSKATDDYVLFAQDLQEKIKFLEKELTVRNDDIQGVLEEKNKIISSLQVALEGRNTVIDSIEDELKHADDKNNDLEKLLEDTNNNSEELQKKLLLLEEYKTTLEININEQESYINQMKIDVDLFKNDITKENEELIEKVSRMEENKKMLEDQLQEKDEYIRKQATEQSSNLSHDQNDLEELKKHIQELEEIKIQLETVVSEKDSELNKLKETYDYYFNLCHSLTAQTNHLNEELEELKNNYEKLEKENQNYVAEFEKQTLITRNLEEEHLNTTKQLQEALDNLQKNALLEEDSNNSREQQNQIENILLEKDRRIKDLENVLESANVQKRELDEEIMALKENLRQTQESYDKLMQEMEEEVARKAAELEEKWMVQVDERGNAVAESWKNHLTIVEQEYNSIHEKLKNELNELEEKCNALVNENNELRKDVDEEIKNEVDRVTSLQQSISDLSKRLSEKEQENAVLKERIAILDQFENKLIEKETELAGLKLIIDTTQTQFEEKRFVVEEIIKILEMNSPWPISCEAEDIVKEVERQLAIIKTRDVEIDELKDKLKELEDSLSSIQEKEEEISRLKEVLEKVQNQMAGLPEKEQEIGSLQKALEDYKVQVDNIYADCCNLQDEKVGLNNAIENYKQQFNSLQQVNIQLEEELNKRNAEVSTLTERLSQVENAKIDNNKEVEQLQSQIALSKQERDNLQQLLQSCQQEYYATNQELSNKNIELENVKQQVAYLQQHVEIIESELAKTRELLQAKEQEFHVAINNLEHTKLREMENYYEEIVGAKDLDNDKMKTQLAESVQNLQSLSESLDNEIKLKKELENRCLQLEQQVSESAVVLEDDEKQLTELKGIIEEQVVKIDDLHRELYEKSKDYDSLVAEVDMGQKAVGNPTGAVMASTSSSKAQPSPEDDLSEPVSRAELDLALYMLHQRDVRCEELTVELTQLLEERDTLQLRLSNAIREKEEIRRKITGTEDVQPPSSIPELGTPISNPSAYFTSSETELGVSPLEVSDSQNLANKLSELRKVGYKRDKTFVDEQEQRRFQQMSIMQQHINEASRLPPEAAAKLVDASYTLSRDVQSPSKVLLNWLWGRSTPKQNDT